MSELLIICGTLMATINWSVGGLLYMVVQMAIAGQLYTLSVHLTTRHRQSYDILLRVPMSLDCLCV